jgi:hypothetical protein
VLLSYEGLDIDPCKKDPCQNIAGALIGTCVSIGTVDFSCRCQLPFIWMDDTNSCAHGSYFIVFNLRHTITLIQM